jgi:excisionase family DNA binding protein
MIDARALLLTLARAAKAAGSPGVLVDVCTLEAALSPLTPVTRDLLTVEQAAARMRVTPGYLYRRAKHLPFTRKLSGRCLRFDAVGLDEWLAAKPAA